jgi:hypothetical protein
MHILERVPIDERSDAARRVAALLALTEQSIHELEHPTLLVRAGRTTRQVRRIAQKPLKIIRARWQGPSA